MFQSKDTEWQIGLKNKTKRLQYAATRDPLQGKGHTQIESKGMEKDIRGNGKKASFAILIIRQNEL